MAKFCAYCGKPVEEGKICDCPDAVMAAQQAAYQPVQQPVQQSAQQPAQQPAYQQPNTYQQPQQGNPYAPNPAASGQPYPYPQAQNAPAPVPSQASLDFQDTLKSIGKFFKNPINTCQEICERHSYMKTLILLGIQALIAGLAGLALLRTWQGFVFPLLISAAFAMGMTGLIMLFAMAFKFKAPFNKTLAAVAASSLPSSCGLVVITLLGLIGGQSAFVIALIIGLFFATMIAGLGVLTSNTKAMGNDDTKAFMTVSISMAIMVFAVSLISILVIQSIIYSMLGPFGMFF